MNKPFIKLFQTPYTYAFFDVNRNEIVSTSKEIYDMLDAIINSEDQHTIDLLTENEKIKLLINEGYLQSTKPSTLKHPMTDFAEKVLQNCLDGITLQVTQDCNFRCSYCTYTNPQAGRQRVHSKKSMNLATAKKAIDFLNEHSVYSDKVNVGFYGGEPFLEFDMIKDIIDYSRQVLWGKELTYNATTNGSMFNDEIVKYCIENGISVLVSLDGNKDTHDKNRVLASTGEGTFDLVMHNLRWIKEKYPQFNIRINMVVDPSSDYDCYNQVYADYDAVKKSETMVNFIDTVITGLEYPMDDMFSAKMQYDRFLRYMYYLGYIDQSYLSPISSWTKLDLQSSTRLADVMAPGGPCIAGASRTFVNIHGIIYPCERCSETAEIMKLGNLDEGFEIDKIKYLMNVGKLTEDQCKNCWAIRHCTVCAPRIIAEDGNSLSVEKKLSNCEFIRNDLYEQIRSNIAIMDAESIIRRKK